MFSFLSQSVSLSSTFLFILSVSFLFHLPAPRVLLLSVIFPQTFSSGPSSLLVSYLSLLFEKTDIQMNALGYCRQILPASEVPRKVLRLVAGQWRVRLLKRMAVFWIK